MGLPPFAREWLRNRYKAAFTFHDPTANGPSVCVYDLMQDVKYMPEIVTTLDQAILYLVNKVKTIMYDAANLHTMIVMVDRAPPPVKRLVTHSVRYRNKDVYDETGGPYLPKRGSDLIPTPWIRFAGNYKLLQRELYPRLLNAFLSLMPKTGQRLFLHGFPGYMEWVTVYSQNATALGLNNASQAERVHLWKDELPITQRMEEEDPQLYNRIFFVEHVAPSAQFPESFKRTGIWKEAENAIAESDGAMFFYDYWFQHNQSIMFSCNDGDIFAYALLYSYERVTMQNQFRNVHYTRLPYKQTKVLESWPNGKKPQFEYVDFNRLYILVKEDEQFMQCGVQNHVATLVFMLIIAESDFFKDYMKGLGAEKVIWKTFLEHLPMFTHLIQLSKGYEPDPRPLHPRTIVIDEDAFRAFVHLCYMEKYGDAVKKKHRKEEVSVSALRAHCAASKKAQTDDEYVMPNRNKSRLWCRQVLWNVLYYKNTPYNHSPNPFEMFDGVPYYPYMINPDTQQPEMCPVVASRAKPVDEVYEQHFHKYQQQRTTTERVSDSGKRKIIERFDF